MNIAASGDVSAAARYTQITNDRSTATAVPSVLRKGAEIQFFHEADASNKDALLVRHDFGQNLRTCLLQSHGWLPGTLQEDFDPGKYNLEEQSTWPAVMPLQDVNLQSRNSGRPASLEPMRVRRIRLPSREAPLLSLVFVRWGGEYSKWMDDEEPNDGDWGRYGSPPSDEYIGHLIRLGVMVHPDLVGRDGQSYNFELFSLFVGSSRDVIDIIPAADQIAVRLKGSKKTFFWMLWPAEWEDTGDADFACYIGRHHLFTAMRACEARGMSSGFPHPADQFELVTSKSWMATLSLHPGSHLPAAVLVSKGSVNRDVRAAARDAIAGLELIRRLNPFPVGAGEPAAPSVINKDGVRKGVVKLGWSWENRFVMSFDGESQLQERLKEMMNQPGCTASSCVVQEWVDFDFEMRFYLFPLAHGDEQKPIEPVRIECNQWGERNQRESLGRPNATFRKLSEEMILKIWAQDRDAWVSAKTQATQLSQLLIAWLRTTNAQACPMIRLDFMLKRLGPGNARVFFGEYCEMGACCLGWVEGPPTIWREALNAALR